MEGFSDRLNELVAGKERGWQAELATKIGVSKPTMSDWASGKVGRVEAIHLFKLADHFGVHARWLGFGIGAKWVREPGYVAAAPDPTIKESLSCLHAAATTAKPTSREQLRKLFDLYWEDPARYAKLLPDMEAYLSGEMPSTKRA
jgi:transcriptional regulator with XRE-family HTH domain